METAPQVLIRAKEITLVPIDQLLPNEKNRNKHSDEQIERLKKIISYQGFRVPVVVSNQTGRLVAGHGRLLAARALGMKDIPVVHQDFDSEDQEYAAGVSDNSVAMWAELDLAGINADLPDMGPDFDIEQLGIKDFVLEPADKFAGDPDEVPPTPKIAKTKRGELWLLGEHRLLIDDCTVKENVYRLMNGEKADMVFTDPPYNIGLDYHSYDDTKSDGDFEAMLRKCFEAAFDGLNEKGHCLFTMGHKWMFQCKSIVESVGFDFRHLGVWHNPQRKAGGNPGMWPISYEAVLDFTKNGFRKLNNGNSVGHMDVWIESPTHETEHPAQKPIKLWSYLLGLCTDRGDLVYEPFSGSGTTLIACQSEGRRCNGLEMDPAYGDVILDRWEKFSGKQAYREEDDMPWQTLKNSP